MIVTFKGHELLSQMNNSIVYTDREKTPAQRQQLIDMGRAWSVAQGATPDAEAEAIYARYVAGEISLQGITDELNAQHARRRALQKPGTATALVAPPIAQRSEVMQPETLSLA